jgi:ribonucleoside-diphosphate reductase beta chain
MYETIPSIKEKDDFVVNLTQSIFDPNFSTEGIENTRKFLHDLIGYYVIMEGIFFYAGFAMMLALKKQNKMVGIGQQFEYIMRDESIHLAFGCDLINGIIKENPEAWTQDFQDEIVELIKQAVELEKTYALDACPDGIVGINARQFADYVEYIADRRLARLGLPEQYGTKNPLLWLSESTDLRKKKNFFETKVTEYQTGTLEWD